jgi:chemotaxis protein methyltransferase CheR
MSGHGAASGNDSTGTGQVNGMTTSLGREAEERFGIKADPDDIEKLRTYLRNTYGAENQEIINKVFDSGEAAGFLTVNETYFFREPAHFSLLWDLLPSFEKTGIRICCAAVSSGCEAYSAAMMIEAYNRGAAIPLSYHIDAFDINHSVIETACRGVYGGRALREDGSCFRYMADPYLRKTENEYRVEQSLKKNIRFFVHNLMDEIPQKEYDVIFFRNAFIYFSQRNRGRIVLNLSKVLTDGGILLLGVSETAGAHNVCSDAGLDQKNRKDVFYFQKKARSGSIYRSEII